LFFE
jgi:hypothetical protein